MKKYFCLTWYATVMLIMSCQKDNETENYVRGQLDGQAFECNTGMSANKPEPIPGSGSDPTLRITGQWADFSLRLMLLGEGTLQQGTYHFAGDKKRSATLVHNNITTYYAGDPGPFNSGQLVGSGSITIIKISAHVVKGSFAVTVVENPSRNKKTITSGEFWLQRK
jgi:hypothetical protein